MPDYFNYTFGFTGQTEEEKHRQFVKNYGLNNFTQYQLITHLQKNQTILITDIYCTKIADCASMELQKLSKRYAQQANPSARFRSILYSDSPPSNLICYNSNYEIDVHCLPSENPVCIFNSSAVLQSCSSNVDLHVHYKFTSSSPDQTASKRSEQFIVCNRNLCNEDRTLIKLEKIAKQHTSTDESHKNIANEHLMEYSLLFFGLLLTIF